MRIYTPVYFRESTFLISESEIAACVTEMELYLTCPKGTSLLTNNKTKSFLVQILYDLDLCVVTDVFHLFYRHIIVWDKATFGNVWIFCSCCLIFTVQLNKGPAFICWTFQHPLYLLLDVNLQAIEG